MEAIPAELQSRYKASLLNKAVSEGEHGAYLRWLRYYLDYESIKGQVNYSSGISNGILEGLSSLVQSAKSKARGYRSTRNLIAMIYLIGGRLQEEL
jgi:hypothetical protein